MTAVGPARIVQPCRLRCGPALRAGEVLWVCTKLDADLVETGRSLVALGASGLVHGELVLLGETEPDGRGFDLCVLGRLTDLGVQDRSAPGAGSRVWYADGTSRAPRVQPQNRH